MVDEFCGTKAKKEKRLIGIGVDFSVRISEEKSSKSNISEE